MSETRGAHRVVALVLAAGAGRRWGGPKALVDIDGSTFLERVLATCDGAGVAGSWVVCPPEADAVRDLAVRSGADAVVNGAPELGMFSSVQAGVRAIEEAGDRWDAVLVHPVDHPYVSAATAVSLAEALSASPPGTWLRPAFDGRGGHPVLVRRGDALRLLGLDPATPFRDALRSIGLAPRDIPVADSGVLRNVNRPADVD